MQRADHLQEGWLVEQSRAGGAFSAGLGQDEVGLCHYLAPGKRRLQPRGTQRLWCPGLRGRPMPSNGTPMSSMVDMIVPPPGLDFPRNRANKLMDGLQQPFAGWADAHRSAVEARGQYPKAADLSSVRS